MRSAFFLALGGLLFVLGASSLALTGWLWFGDWPQEMKEVVDHQRSLGERGGHGGDPTLQDVLARDHVSLGGRWQAVIDPYGRGDLAGIAPRAMEPGHESDLAEFSFENGLELEVPGDWNSQDPRLVFYQGVVWYKRTFEHAPPAGHRTFLWFGAANYDAKVFVNGELVGHHVGGFTPFNWDVTDRLRPGENLLVVRVDNRMRDSDVPTPMTDWLNYGGITRDVLLVDVPETHVQAFEVGLDPEEPALVRARVQLAGPDRAGGAWLRIRELGIDQAIETDEEGRGEARIAASPERWSPASPTRYVVEVATSTRRDFVADPIGFRTIATRGEEILLNGEPIFLRGISIHSEATRARGRIRTRAQAEEILGLARELGCNFVRLAHYTHSQHMARVADELGLLVWEEIPVYWAVDFENEATLATAKSQMREMIERDRNRASVALWSIANETPEGEARNHFLRSLADHVRALDDTRLVTAALITDPRELAEFFIGYYVPALLGIERDEWIYPVHDPLFDVVDVPALNEYFGWYYSGGLAAVTPFTSFHARRVMLDHIDRIRIAHPGGKPFVISETGAGAKRGLHVPEERLAVFSEEYQALVYRKQTEFFERQSGLAGVSPWILKDFRSPLRMYQGVQDYWNLKGLVSDDGEKKLAFHVLREWYETRAAGDAL